MKIMDTSHSADWEARCVAKRKRKRLSRPLGQLTLRGMRQPRPVGHIDDDARKLAIAIRVNIRRFRYPARVYVVGPDVFTVACTYAIAAALDRDPRATLIGTYTRKATQELVRGDIREAQREALARVPALAG